MIELPPPGKHRPEVSAFVEGAGFISDTFREALAKAVELGASPQAMEAINQAIWVALQHAPLEALARWSDFEEPSAESLSKGKAIQKGME